jgi:gliding motility-associated-like protein
LATAACPLSASFELTGLPSGGIWSGPHVDPDGTFDPSVVGSHLVYYTFDGCTDSVVVNVDEITASSILPTLCQSHWADTLEFSPFGGIWSGPGIIDPYYGILNPQEMDFGDFNLLYEVNGCDQEFSQTILEINTGQANDNSCPAQDPYVPYPEFTPAGGIWDGWGIIDENTGMYDPSQIWEQTWTDLIYYAPNGCSDTIHMFSRTTQIVEDTIFFCAGDEDLYLDSETVGRKPWGGEWIGNGLLNPASNDWYFSPVNAGVGQHWLTYDNNNCWDTLLAIVFPTQLSIESISLCSDQPQFQIDTGVPNGGLWSGPGIVDPITGLFDPGVAELGEFSIYWETSIGCGDSVEFVVEEFFQAELGGLLDVYCYQDTSILLDIYPEWAVLTGGDTDSTFNPALANEGLNTLHLVHQGVLCSSEDSIEVFIYPELTGELTASDVLICPGSSTSLLAEADGGLPDVLYQFEWSDGLFPVNLNTAIPPSTQYYYVLISDGCSDPVLDSILIEVLPSINSVVETSDTLCYGDLGWASASVVEPGNYTINWGTNPPIFADQIEDIAGSSHLLQITNDDQGCTFDSLILIPNYSAISALFSVNPNADCIAFEDNPLNFIDLSQHGISGNWDFGNGDSQPYSPGDNPIVNYSQAGDYEVLLTIVNEGDCPDTAKLDLCILPPTPIFIPDIFSPNGDLNNDVFYIRGKGIVYMDLIIYDRWGQKMFETSDPLVGWDGTNRDNPMPSGTYVYHVSVALNSGHRESYQGNFVLIR